MLCSTASKHYVAKREKVTVSLEAKGSGQFLQPQKLTILWT